MTEDARSALADAIADYFFSDDAPAVREPATVATNDNRIIGTDAGAPLEAPFLDSRDW
jgi:hypothetical protein